MKSNKIIKVFQKKTFGCPDTVTTNYITKLSLHYWLFCRENKDNSKKNGSRMVKNKTKNWFPDNTKSGLLRYRGWAIN